MSIVGTRPPLIGEVSEYELHHRARLAIKPGIAEYARKKGLYVEQIKAWKDACMNANGGVAKEASRLNRELKDFEKERRKLEKEFAEAEA